jgi:SAM-dependent methyltransferase
VAYEHPLAYLLGVEGIALLRAFTGEHDRAFVEARLAEVRRLLDDTTLAGPGVEVAAVGTVDGYRIWSRTYDTEPNGAFDWDAIVVEILDGLPAGDALDAACGTGRYSALLAERGHRVVGVDGSPDMLARARERVPEGRFLRGDLHRLPVADRSVDLVTCALALGHVPALGPVFAEFARVLRPGGHLVLCDIHPDMVALGSIPCVRLPGGAPGRMPATRHLVGDYLRAALPVGLRPLRCEEPRLSGGGDPESTADPRPDGGGPESTEQPRPDGGGPESTEDNAMDPGPWDLWPWSLQELVPEATRAASDGMGAMLFWDFERAAHP